MEPSEDNAEGGQPPAEPSTPAGGGHNGNPPESRLPLSADGTRPTDAHELSETVRRTMLSLLGFALVCLLITWSTPDRALLMAEPLARLPYADLPVSFAAFAFLAPLLLVFISTYLHLFYGYWLPGRDAPDNPATLFSLRDRLSRALTTIIFYGLVPVVLGVITRKAGGLWLLAFMLAYLWWKRQGAASFWHWVRRTTSVYLRSVRRALANSNLEQLVCVVIIAVMGVMAVLSLMPLAHYGAIWAYHQVSQWRGDDQQTQERAADARSHVRDKLGFPPDWS